jgi:hypothetical protein
MELAIVIGSQAVVRGMGCDRHGCDLTAGICPSQREGVVFDLDGDVLEGSITLTSDLDALAHFN